MILRFIIFYTFFILAVAHGQDWSVADSGERFPANFNASLGFRSNIEPSLSPSEKTLFDSVKPLIQSNPRTAIEQLRTAATVNSSAAVDFVLGTLLLQETQLTEARRALQTAIRKFPDFLRAHRNLGFLEVMAGNYDAAKTHLLKTIALGENSSEVYGRLGYCWLSLGKPASALTAYNQALLLDPDEKNWQIGKVQALLDSQQEAEAISVLSEMIDQEPANARLWKAQANALLKQGEAMPAARNLEYVRRLGQADDQTLALLGDIYSNEQMYSLAARSYIEALGRRDSLQAARMLRAATSFIYNEQLAEASELLKRTQASYADALSPESKAQILLLKGRIAFQQKENEQAIAYLENATAQDPLNGEALLLLAQLHEAEGNDTKAVFLLERAANLTNYRAKANVALAQVKVQQGKLDEGVRLLELAQQIDPQPNVGRYLEQVRKAAGIQ